MRTLILIAAALMLSGCKKDIFSNVSTSPSSLTHSGDQHIHAVGGPLLSGYPWGLFSLQTQFQKRVTHTKNDDEMHLSNRIFEAHGAFRGDSLLVAFPLRLEHQDYRPFGDGQANAHGDFAAWQGESPPHVSLLATVNQKMHLAILFHRAIAFSEPNVEMQMPGSALQTVAIKDVPDYYPEVMRQEYPKIAEMPVDVAALGWNSLAQGKTALFRPKGWTDWFAVKFQNPYVSIAEVVGKTPHRFKSFSPGSGINLQVPNPLKAASGNKQPPLLQLMERSPNSKYFIFTNDKVHSEYPRPGQPDTVDKTVGGNWTFLLDPDAWQNQATAKTYKQLYSCFAGRAYWEESVKKAISGTSWHNVGDPGEFLVNSIDGETRSLITAIGEKVDPAILPPGSKLAYDLDHVGFSGSLRPGQVFISIQGQYHWHPVHVSEPICIEVWTPFCAVKPDGSGFGMDCP